MCFFGVPPSGTSIKHTYLVITDINEKRLPMLLGAFNNFTLALTAGKYYINVSVISPLHIVNGNQIEHAKPILLGNSSYRLPAIYCTYTHRISLFIPHHC